MRRWLDHNQLEKLTIPMKLYYLNANYNYLKKLPSINFTDSSSSCSFIDTLYLSNNEITTLRSGLSSMCHLQILFA